MALTPTNRATDGGVLPVSSPQPTDQSIAPTKALVNKPTIQPLTPSDATPADPTPPTLPVAQPSLAPVASSPAPSTPTASQGGTTAPIAASPAAPSPYQTNDPLAFLPLPAPTETVSTAPTTAIPNGVLNDPFGNTDGGGRLAPASGTAPAAPTTSSNGTVNLTPTTPDNTLANQTISPGALADRFGIANSKIADWNAQEAPIFDRTINSIAQNRAGAGQIGSGMVRGAFADAANTYDQQRLSAQRGFLNDALTGSIDDAYKNVGIAQQQQGVQIGQAQQGFNNNMSLQQLQQSENGQQWSQLMQSLGFNAQQMQQAFDNAYKTQQLSDDETGQAFQRALQQAVFGASGNPTDIEEWLAGLYALPQGTGAK